jgi:hypothetical protein
MSFIGSVGESHYFLIDRYVGGQDNLKEWIYITTDTISDVMVAGYFADWRGPQPGSGDILRVYTVVDVDDLTSLVSVESVAVIEWDTSYYSLAGASPVSVVNDSTYTIEQSDHNKILDFSGACSVTVPAGIALPFVVGLSQGGAAQITIAAADGVVLNEPDSQLTSEKQYVLLILTAFSEDNFRLIGRTV